MKKVIIKYYTPFLYSTLLIIVPIAFTNYDRDKFWELIIVLLIIILLITLLLGTLNFFYGEKLKNHFKRKNIKKEKLQKFKSIGFYENDNALFGKVDNYCAIVSIDQNIFNGQKWVEIQILFNPKMNSQYIPQYLFEMLKDQSDKSVNWHSNSVIIRKNYNFRIPKYETLLEMIKMTTKLLIKNNINAINYNEWLLTVNDSKVHFKQLKGLKN